MCTVASSFYFFCIYIRGASNAQMGDGGIQCFHLRCEDMVNSKADQLRDCQSCDVFFLLSKACTSICGISSAKCSPRRTWLLTSSSPEHLVDPPNSSCQATIIPRGALRSAAHHTITFLTSSRVQICVTWPSTDKLHVHHWCPLSLHSALRRDLSSFLISLG